jgi:hypothetical protein
VVAELLEMLVLPIVEILLLVEEEGVHENLVVFLLEKVALAPPVPTLLDVLLFKIVQGSDVFLQLTHAGLELRIVFVVR